MKKVYIVLELYVYDYNTDYYTKVFANKEKAFEYFKSKVEEEKENTWIADEEDVIEDYDEERLTYNAYKDGYAAEMETTITIKEEEVL